MKSGESYVKDTHDYLEKLKKLGNNPKGAMVTADVVGLYPSITHKDGLDALEELLEGHKEKNIPTETFLKLAEFVIKNYFFKFRSKFAHQKSVTFIETKIAPTYASILITNFER